MLQGNKYIVHVADFAILPASPYNVKCKGLNLVARSQWQGAMCIFMAYYDQSLFD